VKLHTRWDKSRNCLPAAISRQLNQQSGSAICEKPTNLKSLRLVWDPRPLSDAERFEIKRPIPPRSDRKDGAPFRKAGCCRRADASGRTPGAALDYDVDHQARPWMFGVDQEVLAINVIYVNVVRISPV
jgi:hypothetical protein